MARKGTVTREWERKYTNKLEPDMPSSSVQVDKYDEVTRRFAIRADGKGIHQVIINKHNYGWKLVTPDTQRIIDNNTIDATLAKLGYERIK